MAAYSESGWLVDPEFLKYDHPRPLRAPNWKTELSGWPAISITNAGDYI